MISAIMKLTKIKLTKQEKKAIFCLTAALAATTALSSFQDRHRHQHLVKPDPYSTKTVLKTYYSVQKGEFVDSTPQITATMKALDFLTKYRDLVRKNVLKKRLTKLDANTIKAFHYINIVVNDPNVYFEQYMDSADLLTFIYRAIPVLNGILWEQFQQQNAATTPDATADATPQPERSR